MRIVFFLKYFCGSLLLSIKLPFCMYNELFNLEKKTIFFVYFILSVCDFWQLVCCFCGKRKPERGFHLWIVDWDVRAQLFVFGVYLDVDCLHPVWIYWIGKTLFSSCLVLWLNFNVDCTNTMCVDGMCLCLYLMNIQKTSHLLLFCVNCVCVYHVCVKFFASVFNSFSLVC